MRLLPVALALVLVSGCGSELESDLSFDQARARARALAADSVAALPDGARLYDRDPRGDTLYCGGGEDPPRGTPVDWSTSYEVRGVPLDRRLLARFKRYYQHRGWDVGQESQHDDVVGVENDGHFVLVLTVSDVKVSLTVQGPCVKPADPDHPLLPPSG